MLVEESASRGAEYVAEDILKLAYFCFLNGAPDVGVDELLSYVERKGCGSFPSLVVNSRLYQGVQLEAARFLGSWRTVPDEMWDRASEIYYQIFGERIAGGSDFYPQIQEFERRARGS